MLVSDTVTHGALQPSSGAVLNRELKDVAI